jgi:hypothetical protein
VGTISVAHRVAVFQQTPRAASTVHDPVPAPTPPSTGSTLWADLSNYTGPLDPVGCNDLKNAGYVGIIVQAITGLNNKSWTRQQLSTAVDQGLRIAGYVWAFKTVDVTPRLRMYDGFQLESLWLDVEGDAYIGYPSIESIDRDLALCDAYTGLPTGIYSGKWFFDLMGWSASDRWADRLLWDSDYDGVPDVDHGFTPYGGWTSRAIKQFAGTSRIGRVDQIDLNVMR